ncbi:MAG: hypothetical protein ACLSA2_10685 [Candidatus Gastranaerophilaceae bacterium]
MQDAIVMELDNELSFKAKLIQLLLQSFATVYVDEKEVKRPTVTQSNGLIDFKLVDANDSINKFVEKWNRTRKRINLMVESGDRMYFLKGCSVKKFIDAKKPFTVFYNTYKEA